MYNLLIIGGDNRQKYISNCLNEYGYSIQIFNQELYFENEISKYDGIILPIPVTKDEKYIYSSDSKKFSIDELLTCLNSNQIVFGGLISKALETKLKNNCIHFYDYYKREEVTVLNTVPTTQGILKIILDNIDYTIDKSQCAIFGYGRVAKYTAYILSSLGADVTICARKYGDIALAKTKNLKSCFIKDIYKTANDYNIIINTVPSLVIDKQILENVNKECIIIDVSSAPFGTDFASANKLGIKAIQAPSLPGRFVPKTAGKIIAEGIHNIIKEEFYG